MHCLRNAVFCLVLGVLSFCAFGAWAGAGVAVKNVEIRFAVYGLNSHAPLGDVIVRAKDENYSAKTYNDVGSSEHGKLSINISGVKVPSKLVYIVQGHFPGCDALPEGCHEEKEIEIYLQPDRTYYQQIIYLEKVYKQKIEARMMFSGDETYPLKNVHIYINEVRPENYIGSTGSSGSLWIYLKQFEGDIIAAVDVEGVNDEGVYFANSSDQLKSLDYKDVLNKKVSIGHKNSDEIIIFNFQK